MLHEAAGRGRWRLAFAQSDTQVLFHVPLEAHGGVVGHPVSLPLCVLVTSAPEFSSSCFGPDLSAWERKHTFKFLYRSLQVCLSTLLKAEFYPPCP